MSGQPGAGKGRPPTHRRAPGVRERARLDSSNDLVRASTSPTLPPMAVTSSPSHRSRQAAQVVIAWSTVADLDLSQAFAIFDEQDSGCVSYGIARGGRRLFVKTARTARGRESLRRAARFHQSIRHPAIVHPLAVTDTPNGPQLTYPWCEGTVLNRAAVRGSDRSALERFQGLPVDEVVPAVSTILDAHLSVAGAGFVAVDLYDGCFLYDFVAGEMRLIDLDEYRPGPFTLEADRLPGSQRYMAPEELHEARPSTREPRCLTSGGRSPTSSTAPEGGGAQWPNFGWSSPPVSRTPCSGSPASPTSSRRGSKRVLCRSTMNLEAPSRRYGAGNARSGAAV